MSTQLYEFAHRALPSIAFQMPGDMLLTLSGENASSALNNLWQQAAKNSDPSPDTESTPISVSLFRFTEGNLLAAVISLPTPREPAEAWMVAVIAFCSNMQSPFDSILEVKYFTLEKALTTDTFLCEWTLDHKHINYGPGPAPQVEVFLRACMSVLFSADKPKTN